MRCFTQITLLLFLALCRGNLAFAQDLPQDDANALLRFLNYATPETQETLESRLLEEGALSPPTREALKALLEEWRLDDTAPAFPPEAIDFFENKVRPILAEHCVTCHGPEKQKSDLRLDSRVAILTGGAGGPALVPGEPDNSAILKVISYTGKINMPPNAKLPEDAITAIRDWIAMGAPWPHETALPALAQSHENDFDARMQHARETHWAFQPVQPHALPATQAENRVQSPVDSFILSRLEAAGLQLSAPAERASLIKRVYYDLLGLPPTYEEVQAFVNDPDPAAYEKLLNHLLASPHYGERWGRHWLDVARYADTRGYVFQQERDYAFSHTYRDYVIRSFNEDLPYRDFIVQQLAADKLELGEDQRPLAAMGLLTLNRNFVNNVHDQTDDRIDVVTRGLLGLTVQCARCHDHKFDPISQADYYAMYGVFRSSHEPGEPPLIETPDEADPEYVAYLDDLGKKEKELDRFLARLQEKLMVTNHEKLGAYLLAANDAWDLDNAAIRLLAKERELIWQLLEQWRDYVKTRTAQHDPVFTPWVAFRALPPETFAEQAAPLAQQYAANATPDAPLNPHIARLFEGDAPATMADVVARYERVMRFSDTSWKIMLAASVQRHSPESAEPVELPAALPDAELEAVRLTLYAPDSPQYITTDELFDLHDVPTQNQIRDRRNAIQRVKNTHPGRPDRAMVLVDNDAPFEPKIFKRGDPGKPGDPVPRRFLQLLDDNPEAVFANGSGRLEMAEAIASPDNPLTARVMVNRVWLHHFGKPLVGTPSDFGLRSDPPTHPELLDFLADYFVKHNWSVKELHRVIMLSSTYRQGSAPNEAAHAVDPENKLLWRQNRRRMDFEAMRDALLATSGKLSLDMFGPSVEITAQPFPTRRTVYSRIERQNLPGVFRTFDLANPDTHSPMRFSTTVPQQALYMMNSPFVIEQARALMAREDIATREDPNQKIDAAFKVVFQRDPNDQERALCLDFVENTVTESAPLPPWRYGYGSIDPEAGSVSAFTPLPYFDTQWKGGAEMPDPALGWVSLNPNGGHPGDPDKAAIRRWISPFTGAVRIEGKLNHPQENGDGVNGYILSSRHGVIWQGHAFHAEIEATVESVRVEVGDTLDFVTHCGENTSFDGFSWSPIIQRDTTGVRYNPLNPERLEWTAAADFAGPLPPPIQPWEKLAQTLMMSNEFIFVD